MEKQMPKPRPDIKKLKKLLAQTQKKVARIQADIEVARKLNTAIPLKEVASMLHVDAATVRRMLEEGELKGFRNGSSKISPWWITKRSIKQLHARLIIQYPGIAQDAKK